MQHAAERVERPGESQEALDGKKMPQRFADSACDRIVSPLTWYIIHGCPVMNLVCDGCWLVTYRALCDCP